MKATQEDYQALSKVLEGTYTSKTKLPALVESENSMHIWINSLLDKFSAFINNLFPSIKIDQNSLSKLSSIIIWASVIIFILALVYYLINKKNKPKGHLKTTSIYPETHMAEDPLNKKFLLSIKNQNYSLAARISWKIFLFENKFSQNKTPNEINPKNTLEVYQLMFGGKKHNNKRKFQNFEIYLAETNE